MGGFTEEEARSVEGALRQAGSWLKSALRASKGDPEAALKAASRGVREASRRFAENRDPEWILDALRACDFSVSADASRCIDKVRRLCRELIERDI